MITVRYPNGQAIRYNNAAQILRLSSGIVQLVNSSNQLQAEILPGSGAIVEYVHPCDVGNPTTTPKGAAKFALDNIRQVDGGTLAGLKQALEKFNRKTWRWKD